MTSRGRQSIPSSGAQGALLLDLADWVGGKASGKGRGKGGAEGGEGQPLLGVDRSPLSPPVKGRSPGGGSPAASRPERARASPAKSRAGVGAGGRSASSPRPRASPARPGSTPQPFPPGLGYTPKSKALHASRRAAAGQRGETGLDGAAWRVASPRRRSAVPTRFDE